MLNVNNTTGSPMGLSLTTLISLIIVAIAIVQLARRWIKSGQIQANSSA